MLLTGHNGAGKSSVFRCLAGLWKIPEGQIQKPGMGDGDNSLAGTVFYLPQKPYNVLGTLVDQLTYPELGDSSRLSKDQVKGILEQVDLGYLAERPDVMTTEINWEEHCSLGEKQRLAIARLIWHKPEYAILGAFANTDKVESEPRLCRSAASVAHTCPQTCGSVQMSAPAQCRQPWRSGCIGS